MEDDNNEKDDTKRKSRNLSEKKRRDQFNMLVNELGSMVNTNTRKMDKSTVLKSTILFLKNHNEISIRSRVHEIQEDWKPSFLSNEEFTHLILEALDGFIIVFSSNGRIYYVSESVTSLLGYLPSELTNSTIYEIAYQEDQSHLYNVLLNPENRKDQINNKKVADNQISFTCHIRRGGIDCHDEPIYELVKFIGYFRSDMDSDINSIIPTNRTTNNGGGDSKTELIVFVGTGRLQTSQLIREMSVVDNSKSEFISRHSLEWKFLFLDHRAPPIIGYLPFEVLGTSGYDYYHIDDLDNLVTCHESLMQKGEGTSCHYRFLTKGQQWIWLQTRFYITYNQWSSKPEFIVCTHRVLSYVDVLKQIKKCAADTIKIHQEDVISPSEHHQHTTQTSCKVRTSSWPSKSSKASKFINQSKIRSDRAESDTTSTSHCSQYSQANTKHSYAATHGSITKTAPASSTLSSKTVTPNKRVERTQQPKTEQCTIFLEPSQYTNLPIQSSITGSCPPPATPLITTLPTPELLQQQGIVMTPTQNYIQDELQRKHEELQQLIFNQQEELKRVSEQLLIARYGIFSPILNVNIPYNPSPSQPSDPIISSANARITPPASVPGVSVVPVSISIPVPIVPTELLTQPVAVKTLSIGPSITSHSNMGPIMPQPQSHQQLGTHQQLPYHNRQQQHVLQTGSHLQQVGNQDLMAYQISQPTELIYTDITTNINQQQKHTSN